MYKTLNINTYIVISYRTSACRKHNLYISLGMQICIGLYASLQLLSFPICAVGLIPVKESEEVEAIEKIALQRVWNGSFSVPAIASPPKGAGKIFSIKEERYSSFQ